MRKIVSTMAGSLLLLLVLVARGNWPVATASESQGADEQTSETKGVPSFEEVRKAASGGGEPRQQIKLVPDDTPAVDRFFKEFMGVSDKYNRAMTGAKRCLEAPSKEGAIACVNDISSVAQVYYTARKGYYDEIIKNLKDDLSRARARIDAAKARNERVELVIEHLSQSSAMSKETFDNLEESMKALEGDDEVSDRLRTQIVMRRRILRKSAENAKQQELMATESRRFAVASIGSYEELEFHVTSEIASENGMRDLVVTQESMALSYIESVLSEALLRHAVRGASTRAAQRGSERDDGVGWLSNARKAAADQDERKRREKAERRGRAEDCVAKGGSQLDCWDAANTPKRTPDLPQ